MNALRLTLSALVLTAGLVGPTHATAPAAETTATHASLQVRVEAPFVFDPLDRDDIEDALAWQIEQALSAQDKSLTVEPLDRKEADARRPLLTVTLIQWRTTRLGDVECRFSADYTTADGRQSLGVFEGNTSSLTRSRGFAGRDFEKAAEDAGRQLRHALRERGLL